ncbi:hypothetical protein Pfo_013986 [Paulownia fortunei]|nr:hypothetical protein Pfo_013986 [Paulownia fortunei]
MLNLTKFEFIALEIFGNNYLEWILDSEIYLDAMNLRKTIKEENEASLQDHTKTMIFLHYHLHEELKIKYLIVKDPYVLWKNLKERYDYQKIIILPKARYDWMHLQLQDFKNVSKYNSTMFKITSQLKLYEKKRDFKKYSELISYLLVAEQNNELLMKNHQSRPTRSTSFPEVNAAIVNDFGHSQYRGSSRDYYNQNFSNFKTIVPYHHKWENNESKQEKNGLQNKTPKTNENNCHKCGMKGHWRRTCHTCKYLIDLYQVSLKEKGKCVKTNFIEHYTPMNFT